MSGFTYRKVGSDFVLSFHRWEFGRLSDCEFTHVYQGYKAKEISAKMGGDMSIRERLAVVKSVMQTQTAEEHADIHIQVREAAKKRRDWNAVRNAEKAVEVAFQIIRTRGAHWNPPVHA